MALRKPIVIVNGGLQQLQAGDTLDAPVSAIPVIEAENTEANPISRGQPVYASGNEEVQLARANSLAHSKVIGLVRDASIPAAESGDIQTSGILEAPTAEWDALTGDTGGLTAGSAYWLDPGEDGQLVESAPGDGGDYVVRLGVALSTTELLISIEPPILL